MYCNTFKKGQNTLYQHSILRGISIFAFEKVFGRERMAYGLQTNNIIKNYSYIKSGLEILDNMLAQDILFSLDGHLSMSWYVHRGILVERHCP